MRQILFSTILCITFNLHAQIPISDILNPGNASSNPAELTVFDGNLFFTAEVGSDRNIYSYDGASITPVLAPADNYDPKELSVLDNKLYFSADDGTGRYLYELPDASSAPLKIGVAAYNPVEFISVNGIIYFASDNGMYSYNGTLSSPVAFPSGFVFVNRNAGNMEDPFSEKSIVVADGNLYFHGTDGLYVWDQGTNLVSLACDTDPLVGGDYQLGVINNKVLYMSNFDQSTNYELVEYDPIIGLCSYINVNSSTFSSFPKHFINYGGKLFFIAHGSQNNVTYVYDGINSPIEIVGSPAIGSNGDSYDDPLKIIDGRLYHGNQEVVFDGGNNTYSFSASKCFSYPYFERKVIKISGAYHFVSIDDSGGTFQIFRCDGINVDTLTCHKGYDNAIEELTEYNGQVFYTSLFEDNLGVELYSTTSDGSGLCYDCVVDTLPCIILDGKINLTNTVPAVGDYQIITQNPDGNISSISPSLIIGDDADADPENELQTLAISGSDLTISGATGNTITLPSGTDNLGNHTATQNIDAANFNITNLTAPANPNDAANKAYVDAHTDADASATNELQNISLSNDIISLSNGGGSVTIPSTADNLGNHTATQNIDAANFSIINMDTPINPNDAANKAYVDAHTDADFNPMNEIQNLSISGNDLTLSNNGGTITLPSGGSSRVEDTDQDTYIDVESSSDSDKIEFGISGTKYFEMSLVNGNPILNLWNSDNTIIGEGSGLVLTTASENTIYGELAAKSLTVGSRNIAIGKSALLENIYHDNNIAIGFESLKEFGPSGAFGAANVAVGNNTLRENTTGYEHTAIGHSALVNNTTGIRNVAIGLSALQNNTEGNYNVAVGRVAGMGNVDGDNNVFVGDLAGQNTNGNFNTFLGRLAGRNNTDGDDNVAIGHQSGENATGDSNTSVGENSLRNSSGSNNVGIGSSAGEDNTTGVRNVFVGVKSGKDNTTGLNNVFIGNDSGGNNETGINNTIMGEGAGFNTDASYNTYIGRWAGLQNFTGTYNSALGYGAGSANGEAGLTNTTALGHDSRATASNMVKLGNSAVTVICGEVPYTIMSDARIKGNIKNTSTGLNLIRLLRPVTYNVDYEKVAKLNGESTGDDAAPFIKESRKSKSRKTEYGFIAQEVQQTIDELGIEFQGVIKPTDDGDLYRISYSTFVVPLVKAVQELDDENKKLNKRLSDIEERLLKLEK